MVVTRIIEQCQVVPSPGAPTEQLLKLLHFDIMWLLAMPVKMLFFYLHFDIMWLLAMPVKMLFFYKLQCSESHFLDTLVPNLKKSFALSLKHFAPLAGKILVPHDKNSNNNINYCLPVARYVDGEDSASLTIAVCSDDFSNLMARHSKEAGQLDDLVPHHLPPATLSPDLSTVNIPVIALQVTLFPDQGVCISFNGHHSICDISTMMRFLRTWGSINRSNEDDSEDLLECLPTYDRDMGADGDRLAMEFWEGVRAFSSVTASPSAVSLPTRIVRTTFFFREAQIKTLKSCIFSNQQRDAKVRMSSYVVVCAHLWTSWAKSAAAAGEEEVADDELEYFMCPFDCRQLLNPPLPDTYFGNCVKPVMSESTSGRLRGKDGLSVAAEAIRKAIQRALDSNCSGMVDFSAESLLETAKRVGKKILIVGGSPKLDFYAPDYGWGRPINFEILDGEHNGMAVFTNSRAHKGGMEVCVSMPKVKMDAFAAFFDMNLPAEQLRSKL